VIIIGNVFSIGCSVHRSDRPHRSSDAKPEWDTLYKHLECLQHEIKPLEGSRETKVKSQTSDRVRHRWSPTNLIDSETLKALFVVMKKWARSENSVENMRKSIGFDSHLRRCRSRGECLPSRQLQNTRDSLTKSAYKQPQTLALMGKREDVSFLQVRSRKAKNLCFEPKPIAVIAKFTRILELIIF
jgi:hypothetical protein